MIYSQCVQLIYLNTWQSHISYMKQSLDVDWQPVQSLRTYPNNLGREDGGGAEGGNAEKVILGAKTPHPWCTTTVTGFTKNHALVTHPHSTIGRDKMDICDQKVILSSSDPTNQSLIQQQRKFSLFFFVQKILSI